MHKNIAPYIADLLYDRNSLTIPGLGKFVGNYKPATIDHMKGFLYPPSRLITFDPDCTTDDGALVGFIMEKLPCSKTEANIYIDAFVNDARKLLAQRDMLLVPNVGRLYLDYEDNYQFLQESNNINVDAYGLPAINFYPVTRAYQKDYTRPNAVSHSESVVVNKKKKGISYRLQQAAPVLISAVAVAFAIVIYNSNVDTTESNVQVVPVAVNEVHVNKSPQKITEQPKELIVTAEEIDQTAEKYTEALNTEASTLPDHIRTCIIVVGQFRKKEGVRMRVEEIYDLGYDVYTDKNKNLTRVGLQFSYESYDEVKDALKLVRKRFDKSAFVFKD